MTELVESAAQENSIQAESSAASFFQPLFQNPLRVVQNLEIKLLFCLSIFVYVIWFTKRDQQRKNAADAGSETGSLSSSMDDTSKGSHRQAPRTRTQSQEFLLSPFVSKKPSLIVMKEMYQSLRWTDETEADTEMPYRRHSNNGGEAKQHQPQQTPHAEPSRSPQSNVKSPQAKHETIVRHGPFVNSMVYNTWTPPPSWIEAAKRVFPRDVKTLRRTLKINLLHQPPTLTIADGVQPKKENQTGHDAHHAERKDEKKKQREFCLSVTEFSVHPTPPTEGVLEVYVKNSPKSEWMEHTFQSAQAATQFQTDLLAAQLLGPAIQNMYNVFRLIHQGSIAHDGQECVLHDCKSDTDKDHLVCFGVAWDDVMRCFGSTFPGMRIRLEEWWWNETKPKPVHPKPRRLADSATSTTDNNNDAQPDRAVRDVSLANTEGGTGTSLEYVGKRMLIGPVDFFRLFVPTVPHDAKPYTTSDVKRMEQLLRWRKRVARACLLLETYARARQLVNVGWKLTDQPLPDEYFKFRLSYDMNVDNQARDKTAKSEIYEPYVSRDVFCRVRGANFPQRKWWNAALPTQPPGDSVLSLGQAFSLVGVHCFRFPTGEDNTNKFLNFATDPVRSAPSLYELVSLNPDVEFVVLSMFNTKSEVATVMVFARNLAQGVDEAFDSAWGKFKGGDGNYRKQKLEFQVALELSRSSFHLIYSLGLKFTAFLIWLLDPRAFVFQTGNITPDRYTLPPMRLEAYGPTRHFGGALRKNHRSPSNYVAVNVLADSKSCPTLAGRTMLAFVVSGFLRNEIADLTLKIRGDDEADLPERALATARVVQPDFYRVPLAPSALSNHFNQSGSRVVLAGGRQDESPSHLHLMLKALFHDPCVAWLDSVKQFYGWSRPKELGQDMCLSFLVAEETVHRSKPAVIATNDPIEKAVNKLIELLEDVRIPVRGEERKQSANVERESGALLPVFLGPSPSADKALETRNDLRQVSILEVVNRSDLRRYFVAANCSLKKATVRTVESAAWRGLTFPVDLLSCRVELQTGQFFQQGRDKMGHPIFYFRNMCRGPWRGDEDATIAAVVHRLEKSFAADEDPDSRWTVIILLGKPRGEKKKKREESDTTEENADNASSQDHDSDEHSDGETSGTEHENMDDATKRSCDNPRVPQSESLFPHSSERLVERLVQLLMLHYPERLYRALVVKGHGAENVPRTLMGMKMALSGIIDSPNTRRKVVFLHQPSELRRYVDKNELIQIASGEATISRSAFDFA